MELFSWYFCGNPELVNHVLLNLFQETWKYIGMICHFSTKICICIIYHFPTKYICIIYHFPTKHICIIYHFPTKIYLHHLSFPNKIYLHHLSFPNKIYLHHLSFPNKNIFASSIISQQKYICIIYHFSTKIYLHHLSFLNKNIFLHHLSFLSKNIFASSIISQQWNLSSWKSCSHLSYIVNTATADDPVTLLLTWINFSPSMDDKSHAQKSVGWHYLSIPKLQRCNRWSLGMDK